MVDAEGPSTQSHTVKAGESLSRIADRINRFVGAESLERRCQRVVIDHGRDINR